MIAIRLNTGTVKADSREDPPVRWEQHGEMTVPLSRILYIVPAIGPKHETGGTLDPTYSIVGIEGRGDVAVREPRDRIEHAYLLSEGVWRLDLNKGVWLRVTPYSDVPRG